MGSPRARLGLGIGVVMDCYIRLPPPRLFSTKYARNAQYARGPPSLHDTHYCFNNFIINIIKRFQSYSFVLSSNLSGSPH